MTFIDYEYAQPNYQAFDIGNYFCEFAGEGWPSVLLTDTYLTYLFQYRYIAEPCLWSNKQEHALKKASFDSRDDGHRLRFVSVKRISDEVAENVSDHPLRTARKNRSQSIRRRSSVHTGQQVFSGMLIFIFHFSCSFVAKFCPSNVAC